MGYLLSVVVPTKDRYFYLKHMIELIKSFNSDDIELIIQDNTSDNKEILDYLNNLDYPHLKYFHTKEQISVSENSTKAISNSTGEYVCFIGDDDGVLPQIIEVLRMLKPLNPDAIITNRPTYNWPDFFDDSYMKLQSTIVLAPYSAKIERVNIQKALNDVINNGFVSLGVMPKLYHAIVCRKVLDNLYSRIGTYLPGASPDMASAVALCFCVNKLYSCNLPLIVAGQCKNVGGGERALKGKLPWIGDVAFLPDDIVKQWNKHLPDVWCSDTIWPQTGIKALEEIKKDRNYSFDYDLILARFFSHHLHYLKKYFYLSKSKSRVIGLIVKMIIRRELGRTLDKFVFYCSGKKRVRNASIIRSVNDINEASSILSNQLEKITWRLILDNEIKLMINS